MGRFRQKRSTITSIADRNSGDTLILPKRPLRQGNRQIQKQRSFPKLASDSSSCSSGTTEEDLFTLELGRSSSGQAIGTPMKKLLAEEMSKETETKRRSPSVIARLMGLDGLPPQQPVHKQQKRFSENYQQRTASIGFQRNGTPYEGRSHRRSVKEQQEFKDVFEVLETSKVERSSYPSQGTANTKLTEAEMAFIRQKFMDAKRLSTDEKLQDSKEFHDALEVLDSNKDLLLKFLQQPDSLFAKHLHDLRGAPPQSHCGHIGGIKSSNVPKYENNAMGLKSDRETSRKCDISSPRKHHDGRFNHNYNKHGAHNSLKPSKIHLEGKDETRVLPTRIVVLKPNLGKAENATKSVSSAPSSHDFLSNCRKHTEYPSIRSGGAELLGKKNLSNDVGLSRHKSRESREIAKEITRQMRDSVSSSAINFSSSGFRGYAADESSSNMSGNDSANESEATTLTSRNSFDWNNRYRPSSSHSTESTVSREAKKRLSERWKMTHRFQDVGMASKGSTLGEMLAIPDRAMRDAMTDQDGPSGRFANDEGSPGWVGPLGISSSDGWKDGCIRTLSRSKSLPASSAPFGSPKTRMRCEALNNDRYLMPKEATNRGRNKAVKGNFNQKEGLFSRNLRSSNKKSQSSRRTSRENNDILREIHCIQNQTKSDLEDPYPSEQKSMVSETSASNVTDTSSGLDAAADAEHENLTMYYESPNELLPEPSACVFVKGNSAACDPDDSIQQEPLDGPSEEGSVLLHCPVPEPESPASSKEADQPSPISVLEAPFTEDLSSGSECFERVSADLHGLRMQLQLLKLESEAYAEGPMLVSSDEDDCEGSVRVSEEKGIFRAEESWESSYLVDVLIDSGFDDTDADMFMETWYSPECPLSPLVFENLEKKYCDQATVLRSERRLLFDRINAGLLEIFQQFMDPHPWVKPATRRIGLNWHKDGLGEELCKLLASQEKKVNQDAAEKVLGREWQWLDLGDDIDVIGLEIERLLIDELVAGVVSR